MDALRGCTARTALVLASLCVGAAGCSSATPQADEDSRSADGEAAAEPNGSARTSTLECADHIGTGDPAADLTEVAGVVALPVASRFGPLQVGPTGEGHMKLFAKQGLAVKTGRSFELIVPREERKRLAIGWGSPANPSWRLRVSCRRGQAAWLSFAGGYFVPRQRCASLIVRVDGHQERVRIAVGARCESH